MTPEEMVLWIQNATTEELLQKWRFDASPSPWFEGYVGGVFRDEVAKRRKDDPAGWSKASKLVGWRER